MMIRTLETLIYDCPNSTSNGPPKSDPPRKNGLKSWGVTREVGGQLLVELGQSYMRVSNVRIIMLNLLSGVK